MTEGAIGAAKMDGDSDGPITDEFNGMDGSGVEKLEGSAALPMDRPDWGPIDFSERIWATASTGIDAEHNDKTTAKAVDRMLGLFRVDYDDGAGDENARDWVHGGSITIPRMGRRGPRG